MHASHRPDSTPDSLSSLHSADRTYMTPQRMLTHPTNQISPPNTHSAMFSSTLQHMSSPVIACMETCNHACMHTTYIQSRVDLEQRGNLRGYIGVRLNVY